MRILVGSLACVALTLASAQAPQASAGTTLDGRSVSLTSVATLPPFSGEVASWDGWRYGEVPQLPDRGYPAGHEWPTQLATVPSGAPQLSIRAVLFARIEATQEDNQGRVIPRRFVLADNEIDRIAASFERFRRFLERSLDGKARVHIELTVEREWIEMPLPEETARVIDLVNGYLLLRTNGGTFTGEDRTFRGPFHHHVAVLPQPYGSSLQPIGRRVLQLVSWSDATVDGEIESALHKAWNGPIPSVHGGANGHVNFRADQTFDANRLASWIEVDGPTFVQNFTLPSAVGLPAAPALGETYRSPQIEISVVEDATRGRVLRYLEKGSLRAGGVAMPIPKPNAERQRYLRFWVRSSSADALALRLFGQGGAKQEFVLGRLPRGASVAGTRLAFESNGSWQAIVLDLRAAGIESVSGLHLGPPSGTDAWERRDPIHIDYRFDDFEFLEDAQATPVVEPATDPELDEVAQASMARVPSPVLLRAVRSSDDALALTALAAFTRIKDENAVEGIVAAATTANPFRQRLAYRALGFQATPNTLEVLRRAVRFAGTGWGRGEAAMQLAQMNPPGVLGDLSLLITHRSLHARASGATALSKLTTEEASIVRMAFLQHSDPMIQMAVTIHANPKSDYEMRKLLWSAVNEPFDAIRLESAKKLTESQNAEFQSQGYRAVRDDSVRVRTEFLQWLGENPKGAHVPAVLLALTDVAPSVRAAALQALARLPGERTLEELEPVLKDRHPFVQRELAKAARAKGLRLPEETLALIRACPIEQIAALAELAGS